jgi:hypothetical protein
MFWKHEKVLVNIYYAKTIVVEVKTVRLLLLND